MGLRLLFPFVLAHASNSVSSFFDAIYAATALAEKVADHTIISIDQVYDRISGVKRIDSRELKI